MPTELSVEIVPNELVQIVGTVFETMLRLETSEGGTAWYPSQERLTAAVRLTGHWNGEVLIECDRAQACRFAGRFLSEDPPDSVDEVVRDVLGELANMIGGNMKCVLTAGIRLSMPAVTEGSGYVRAPEILERIAFQCEDGPFWVTVLATPSN
jgi:chemotaxis protein CheX